MSDKVEIFRHTVKVGEVDRETVDLVKMYLSEGKNVKEILLELKEYGLTTALAVNTVLNARRALA